MTDTPEQHDELAKQTDPARVPADRPKPGSDDAKALGLACKIAQMLDDFDCADILVFDLRGVSPITSYIVIASGTSDRQIKALGARATDLAESLGSERYGSDTDQTTRWVVLDFVDVMAHLFEPATRSIYDLEMLWGDAPSVHWQREK
ncbi:ribosome silencing factor [Phycisphaeraceae bacterium D3-23]